MEVTARDIEQVEFHDAWRGYNQGEVDDFLDQVGETVERLERENEFLRARLQELESSAETARVSEEMLKKTLLAAQQTAEETIAEAKAQADRILGEASSSVDSRKHDIEESLASLQRFESETKQRLRDVLEGQLRALDALNERPPAQHEAVEAAAPSVFQTLSEPPSETGALPGMVDDVTAPPVAEENVGEVLVEESAEEDDDTDSSVFEFEGAEETEPPLDDFRPFDDEAELQGRRRRGLFRRKVDDWA